MFYCVASLRKLSPGSTQEYVMHAKGQTKGEALKYLYVSGGVIFWFEEISQEDYEILTNSRNKGEFKP